MGAELEGSRLEGPPLGGGRQEKPESAAAQSRRELYQPLLRDMCGTLRSEIGARTIYPLLARFAKQEDLRQVLHTLAREEELMVFRLSGLVRDLGGRPVERSLRRSALAWVLFLVTPVIGLRFALRLCHDAEARVSRWYHGYAAWFADLGEAERAMVCQELSHVKRRHALAIETFAIHSPRRLG